ncbi:MAG TPA: NADH-quinone oxidoreductase subunit L [Tepidisphaeraceae bacterium]|nr:NADH-quinone oxidoreductase subunit L [Tepidisphaeraceae bacterium]
MGLDQYVGYSWLIPLLPLIGAAIAGFWGARHLRGQSHWPIWLGVGAAALFSVGLLVAVVHEAEAKTGAIGHLTSWFTWIEAGRFKVDAGAWIDPLTAVMLVVVTGIGFFITVFAAGYMKGEAGYWRFFAFLGLFIFMMTCLVLGNNFVMLYLGWEGVGLCSYLLIGYYYERPAARDAAKKAFLANRVGDLGFGIGIMLIYMAFGTVNYFGEAGSPGVLDIVSASLTGNAPAGLTVFQRQALDWIPFCLLLGAIGKSAQFPLYVWLPDAMEGPTPVSALIHAATMVTAGVYMIARCSVLFVATPVSLVTVAVVGAVTALLAATIAMRQFDLKKVFAYSTVSQLGFMFVAVGVLAPVAGAFHLVTHAFFKALLFLSSGVVMHAMMGELDMRKMSGLKRVLPKTRWLMLIGCAALAGFPFLSGFYSKDMILAAAWEHSKLLGGVLLLTAFLTAYYTFRLYFRVFEGPTVVPAAPDDAHPDIIEDDAHATASAAAVHAGDTKHSGVDEHLATASHQAQTHGHDDHGHHDHEPGIMIMPLVVLAVGSVVVGFLLARGDTLGGFLGRSPSLSQAYTVAAHKATPASPAAVAPSTSTIAPEPAGTAAAAAHPVNPVNLGQHQVRRDPDVIEREHAHHLWMAIASGIIALAGIGLAYYMHLKNRRAADRLAAAMPGVTRAVENKYWVDEVYAALFVEPLKALGRFFYAIDRLVIDGILWLIGFVPQFGGFTLKLTTQRGFLQGYAASMVFGIVVILLIVLL